MKAALPVSVALVSTLVLQALLGNVVPPEAYLFRLFRPPGGWVMGLVPGIIFLFFVWTMVDLVLKHGEGRANEADLDRREIRQLPSLVAQESVPAIQRRILALDTPDRPVARRLLWLLYYLEHNADAQRTHELLRHQADLDADTAAAGYRTVKLFIWAMPILGFVGTVLGISLSVGGFSNFLTSDLQIDDVSQVTAELGNVASGLSFAFDTTLLGLLGGLVANVMLSGVQKRDERFFTRLEELGLSIVANSRPAAVRDETGAAAVARAPVDPRFEALMHQRIEEIGSLVDRTRQVMQGLSEASARMSTNLNESMASVKHTVDELGETSVRMGTGLNESMTSVKHTIDDLGRNLQGVSEALAADAASQESVEQAVQRLSASIAAFGDGLAQLRTEQATLAPVLRQLAGPLELRLVPGTGLPRTGSEGATST
jgi:biopolymer transport protein ExbB/TolQ